MQDAYISFIKYTYTFIYIYKNMGQSTRNYTNASKSDQHATIQIIASSVCIHLHLLHDILSLYS